MKYSTLTLVGIVCLSLAASLCGQQAVDPASPSSAGPAALGNPSADGPLQQASAQATVPRLIKFNGVLRDLSGKPLSGPVDVTFSLYSEEAGGNALWFETQTVQADSLGNYTALLGAMSASGVPMELFTSGEAHWLGVQISNLPEQSRVLLVSVPYAMKAGDAETLGGKPASAYQLVICSGDVPSPTVGERSSPLQPDCTAGGNTAILSGLITKGAATTTTNESPITNAITSSYIPVFTDGAGTTANSIMFQSGTKIGVNTNSPAFNFDVNGFAVAIGTKTAAPGNGGTLRFRDDTGTVRWLFGLPGSAGSQDFQMYNYSNGHAPLFIQNGAASYSLYMSNSGNVGIGTSSPGQKLSVAGVVESTSGGFKFPDGSTQTTAATGGGGGGGGAATDLNCVACVSSSEVDFNYAGSNSKGGDATNALLLNGMASSAFQPAGTYATLGTNTFTATQTISSGNLNLPATTGSSSGVISLGGNSLLHAYGSNNLFVGKSAGNFSLTGSYNTATGAYALLTNDDGNSNTANGYSALLFNTSGYQNTAAGASALYSNTSGYQNTASGEEALYSNTTGQNNTAAGYFALKANISGNDNTAVGWSALSAVSYGASNTALGSSALSAGSVGSANTAIGAFSGPSVAGLNNSTAIGYNAKVSQNNSLVLGGTGADAVSVGIGLTAPAHKLDVVGDVNITGCYLYGGSGTYGNCSSDARLKTNIRPFEPALEKVTQLQPVHFEWRDSNPPEYRYGRGEVTGLVAQQVEEVFPALVSTDSHGFKRVNYGELPFLLLEGERELKARNDDLRAQVEEQQKQIASLRRENDAKSAELAAVKIKIEELRRAQDELTLAVARLMKQNGEARIANASNAAPPR